MTMKKLLKKRLKNQRGLTLVELLAVVVILGIISAIAVPSIGKIIEETRVKAVKADAIQIINAAKLYVAAHGEPDDNKLEKEELSSYLEDLTHINDDYVVHVNNGSFSISADSTKPEVTIGSSTTGATIQQINGSGASLTVPKLP
ncbi:MAG: prepilin-type cleavage/methylation protein [Bacillales bacterium]|jgi:type IV pilus assembly protein PilA|nr:prepilin-type cleavage/methylation protein [Bacillales bacterium]